MTTIRTIEDLLRLLDENKRFRAVARQKILNDDMINIASAHDGDAPKYPDAHVDLSSIDGNAFALLGEVSAALRRVGVSKQETKAFISEATSGDYTHLIGVCLKWVSVGVSE